jgi:hemerythrin-like domain-containing protein
VPRNELPACIGNRRPAPSLAFTALPVSVRDAGLMAQSLRSVQMPSQPPEIIMPRNAATKTSSKTSPRTSSKAAKSGAKDAIALLTEDHKKVKKMFEQFEKMKEDEDDDAKQMLVEMTCAELTVHAQIEEEIFYPALRDAIDDMDLLDEAEVEHASAKQLISELSAMQPGDELYDAKFKVLGEYVNHHVEEEENELFPKAKKSDADMVALGEELMARKMELRDELGLSEGDEDEDTEDAGQAKAAKKKNVH